MKVCCLQLSSNCTGGVDQAQCVCRVCEFVAAMASAGSAGAQLLISNGTLSSLRIPLQDFVNYAQRTPAEEPTDWDNEAAGADESFPSLPAVEAVLDGLEVRESPHAHIFACQQVCSMSCYYRLNVQY